ncbi:hypothetical protein [Anaeromyxobacter oryzisoli]|uniref:hypothetical protein n=1 Tax=Anaeromyxobacter oryzisoli TaxID=2925408 RepID=UPI001F55C5D8|nr:hypothetical protein [Anaeromyxobacter sp. SG63]
MTRSELIEAINQTGRPGIVDEVLRHVGAAEAERDAARAEAERERAEALARAEAARNAERADAAAALDAAERRVADAQERIAALEGERDALAAKVSQIEAKLAASTPPATSAPSPTPGA